jgi:hypothetical protein
VRLLCQLSNLNIVVQTKIVWFFCGFAPLKGYTASAVTMAFYGVSVAIPLFSLGLRWPVEFLQTRRRKRMGSPLMYPVRIYHFQKGIFREHINLFVNIFMHA